ncbi:MAG TPA: tripartite tricarboxylate transporter substrate binding protein [Burkholderiaceae bacterium]|nr:tripartite tricarboxylate transporter substrate binding protein [Burkholderiaceae bacterium]
MHRSNLLRRLALLAAAGWPLAAAAQGFPERPIQLVVPFGPGGTTDIMARLLADEFGRQLGGSVVVVNTAGAGGSIAMGNVARARPDGHTLSMTTIGPLTIQPARRDNTGYTPESFDYICGTYDVPMLTMVPTGAPYRDYAALVAWARSHPGRLNYGSSGLGTMPHISALLQWKHHAVEALHVPYKSTGDMVVPLKNGEITVFNETPPVALQHQLRPLVALTDARVPGFEDVPSAKEVGLPVRASVWGGVVAPKGLPGEVRGKLEAACKAATATTLYKARAQAANSPLVWRDGEAFRRFALAEFQKFRQTVAENGLQER